MFIYCIEDFHGEKILAFKRVGYAMPNGEIQPGLLNNLIHFGVRALCIAAPSLWSSIPLDLESVNSTEIFKKKLKTYLFRNRYC